MPYDFRFRGHAEGFRANEMHDIHDHASYVFEQIILPWLSKGPEAGGPNLPEVVSDLESYRLAWMRTVPQDHGLDEAAHHAQNEQFLLLRNNGTWKLLTVSRRVVAPEGRVSFTFGFELTGQNPHGLEEIPHATRDIWCDLLIGNFRAIPPGAEAPRP